MMLRSQNPFPKIRSSRFSVNTSKNSMMTLNKLTTELLSSRNESKLDGSRFFQIPRFALDYSKRAPMVWRDHDQVFFRL